MDRHPIEDVYGIVYKTLLTKSFRGKLVQIKVLWRPGTLPIGGTCRIAAPEGHPERQAMIIVILHSTVVV